MAPAIGGAVTSEVASVLESATTWAHGEARIEALALVGSHARGEARPGSDVDLVVLTPEPEAFLARTEWLACFGVVARCERETWGRMRTLRLFLASGVELEIGFATPDWAAEPLDPGTRRVVSDGMRVLFDRGGRLRALAR
jgi:hypothetical protein